MWLVAVGAFAQQAPQFDGQVFRPSADSEATLWTEDTHTAPDGYASARGYLQYARAPVRWRGADGDSERLVSDLLAIDALGSVRWRSLRLGLHVPLYVAAGGAAGRTEPGIGDIAIDLKGTVLGREDSPVGVGAAILGRMAVPTSSLDVPLGASGTSWELLAVADREFGPLVLAANLGTRVVPEATYEDLVWNDQFLARFGGGWRWTEDLGTSLELAAQTNWASGTNPAGTAVELLGGGWVWLRDGLVARGGLSLGLTRSPGAPVARLVVGVAFEPDPAPDRDHDGVINARDQCPDDPEDPDGYRDEDGCADASFTTELRLIGRRGGPVQGRVTLEGPDRVVLDAGDPFAALHPGSYTVTAEAEGYLRWSGAVEVAPRQGERIEIALVPEDGELKVFAVGSDGAPVSSARISVSGGDAVRAGTPLALEPGEHAVVVSAEGYRAQTATVIIEGGQQRELSIVLERLPPGEVAPTP